MKLIEFPLDEFRQIEKNPKRKDARNHYRIQDAVLAFIESGVPCAEVIDDYFTDVRVLQISFRTSIRTLHANCKAAVRQDRIFLVRTPK